MSLKRNIFANYISQMYVTLVGIVLVPLYMKYMGAEAYGLVGFFTVLQSWFALLDMGLTQTISRETARYRGGITSALQYRQLFRGLSLVFVGIALLGGGGLWQVSDFVATRWLNVKEIAQDEVILAVQIMCVSVALRWMGGLYRGVVTGSEQLVWMSSFNAVIATLRFVVVFASMSLFGFTPFVFFLHQLVVAVFEILGLVLMAYRLLPAHHTLGGSIGLSFKPIQPLLKFALTIAFTSSVWVLVTQSDKLVLSGILPLAEYGYFTLAVLVASGVTVISAPITSAVMPRMTRLYAEAKHVELVRVYRKSSRLVSTIAGSAAITIAFCAEHLLFAWTGSNDLAVRAAPILKLYALGNGLLAVCAFPYYMQYAKGNLRYHLIGNGVLVVLLVPSIVYAASRFGGEGAGWVWLGMNAFYLFTWLAYVHGKIEPGLHLPWIFKDVLLSFVPSLLVVLAATQFKFEPYARIQSLGYVAAVGIAAILFSFLSERIVMFARLKVAGDE